MAFFFTDERWSFIKSFYRWHGHWQSTFRPTLKRTGFGLCACFLLWVRTARGENQHLAVSFAGAHLVAIPAPGILSMRLDGVLVWQDLCFWGNKKVTLRWLRRFASIFFISLMNNRFHRCGGPKRTVPWSSRASCIEYLVGYHYCIALSK